MDAAPVRVRARGVLPVERTAAVTSIGSIVAAAIAVKKALIIGLFTATVPAVLTGLVLSGGTIVGYRAAYRGALGKARRELTRALDAIEGGIQSEALFGALAPPRLENPVSDPLRRG